MDVDHNDSKMSSGSSSVKSNGTDSSPRFPAAEVHCVNERNDIRLRGKMTEENSVTIDMRIYDLKDDVRRINFSFYLEEDTAHTIAQEMVIELDLVHEDVAVITELIDNLILELVPTWKPSFKKSISSCIEEEMNSPESSIILQIDHLKVSDQENNKGSEKSSFTYSGDWMKSSSNGSSLFQDDEMDQCEDLKQELDAIDAKYQKWCSDIQKYREEAIENAKKKWDLKKVSTF